MHFLFHYVLWEVNLHPDLCTVFKAWILNQIDTFAFASVLIYDGAATESDNSVIEILMMN